MQISSSVIPRLTLTLRCSHLRLHCTYGRTQVLPRSGVCAAFSLTVDFPESGEQLRLGHTDGGHFIPFLFAPPPQGLPQNVRFTAPAPSRTNNFPKQFCFAFSVPLAGVSGESSDKEGQCRLPRDVRRKYEKMLATPLGWCANYGNRANACR